jgi:vancomycin aglycone glucosyltransferase
MGSRGDVQPMLALACAMRTRGHEVIVHAGSDFAAWIAELGFPFLSCGQSIQEWLRDNWDDVNGGPRRFLRAIRRIGADLIPAWFDTTLHAAQGVDVIVSANQFAAQTAAEKYGIPLLCVAYSPTMLRSSYHAPVFMSPQGLPRWLNSLLWSMTDITVWRVVKRCVNRERVRLDMPPVDSITRYLFEGMPYLLPCDEVLSPTPPDWSRFDVTTTGPWFYDDPLPIDPQIDAFLAAGLPPVYIGFGSMVSSDVARLTRVLLDAVDGQRLLLSAGWAGLGAMQLPASVKVVNGPIPHAALFPRVAAVVHHGGAGTTVAALRAGAPQVVVPHLADQFYNAHRLDVLGLAPRGIPINKLTAQRLRHALASARALPPAPRLEMAARLRKGDGLARAVAIIERAHACNPHRARVEQLAYP